MVDGHDVVALPDCVLEAQDGKMKMRNRLGAMTLAPILALLMVGSSLAILAQPTSAEWTGGWTSEPAMGETRTQAVVVGSPEGIVYVLGGVVNAATYTPVPNAGSYNTSSGSWTDIEPMPRGVRGAAGAMGLDGFVYVFSGVNTTEGVTNETQIYNPAADTWSLGTDIPAAAWEAKAATGEDGRIYVVGGEIGAMSDIVQIYDPATDTWDTGASLPDTAVAGAMASSGDYIYYAGGGSSSYTATDVLYRYSISADEWTTLPSIPSARAAHALEVGHDGLLYVIGGSDSASNIGTESTTTYVFDPDDETWTNGPSLNAARKYHGAALSPDGRVYCLGGNDGTTALNSVESLQLYLFDYEVSLSSPSVRAGDSMLVTVDSHFTLVEEMTTQVDWYIISEAGTHYGGNWEYNPTTGPMSFEVTVPELAEIGNFKFVINVLWSSADVVPVVLYDLEYPFEVLPAEPLEDMISDLEDMISNLALQITDIEAQVTALEAELVGLQTEVDGLNDSMAAAEVALTAEIAALESALQSALDDLEDAMESGDEDLMDEISSLQDKITVLESNLSALLDSLDQTQESVDDVQTSVDSKAEGSLLYAVIGLLVVVIVLLIVMMMMGRKRPEMPLPPA